MKKKLYICHTMYHIYVTLCKEIEDNNDIDIIISDTVPNREKIIENIKSKGIFNNIYIINEKQIELPNSQSRFSRIKLHKNIVNCIYKYIPINLNIYNDIYIYNDNTKIGFYLIATHTYYNLLEDGLNSFTIIDKYADVNYSKKSRIASLFNLNILVYGQSKYAKCIEVNSLENIKIPLKKVNVFSKENMTAKICEDNKKIIYDIFCKNKQINSNYNGEKVLILTQPLYKDMLVSSQYEQKNIYKSIVDKFNKGNNVILIKPHPRDDLKYDELFDDVIVIDKDVPIEILNFDDSVCFDKVVTISSTSLNGIDFAKDKIELGWNYINDITKIS